MAIWQSLMAIWLDLSIWLLANGYLAKKRTGHPLMWKAVGIRFKEGRDVGMAISGV